MLCKQRGEQHVGAEDLKPHQWKPGQSGNPAGYSRGRRAIDHLLDLIEERDVDKAIAERWLTAIMEGDFRYMKEYLERRDGKVKDTLDVTATAEASVVILPDNGRSKSQGDA